MLKASIPILNRKVEVKVKIKEKISPLWWESFLSEESFLSCILLLNLSLSLNLVLQNFYSR
jgi:hypothetical protein